MHISRLRRFQVLIIALCGDGQHAHVWGTVSKQRRWTTPFQRLLIGSFRSILSLRDLTNTLGKAVGLGAT